MEPPIPETWTLALTDRVSQYMVKKFQHAIGRSSFSLAEIDLPGLSLEALCEANRMVDQLVSAYQNKGASPYIVYPPKP